MFLNYFQRKIKKKSLKTNPFSQTQRMKNLNNTISRSNSKGSNNNAKSLMSATTNSRTNLKSSRYESKNYSQIQGNFSTYMNMDKIIERYQDIESQSDRLQTLIHKFTQNKNFAMKSIHQSVYTPPVTTIKKFDPKYNLIKTGQFNSVMNSIQSRERIGFNSSIKRYEARSRDFASNIDTIPGPESQPTQKKNFKKPTVSQNMSEYWGKNNEQQSQTNLTKKQEQNYRNRSASQQNNLAKNRSPGHRYSQLSSVDKYQNKNKF